MSLPFFLCRGLLWLWWVSAMVLGYSLPSWGQEGLSLKPSSQLNPSLRRLPGDEWPIFMFGNRIHGTVDQQTTLEGQAELRRYDMVIRAENMVHDAQTNEVTATGNVRIQQQGDRYRTPKLHFNLDQKTGELGTTDFYLDQTQGHGQARQVDIISPTQTVLHEVGYSTCPRPTDDQTPWQPDWMLKASSITLDSEEQTGWAKGARLYFKDVPILAAPIVGFPTGKQRKSGFLAPAIAHDQINGWGLSVPYYFNLAPQTDATLTSSFQSKRGLEWEGEWRYLGASYQGKTDLFYLPNDWQQHERRWLLTTSHQQRFETPVGNLETQLNLRRASDDSYWRDFPKRMPALTPRLLPSEAVLSWRQSGWSASMGAYTYQTLQDATSPILPPYDRLPEINLGYQTQLGDSGWQWQTQAQSTDFVRVTSTSNTDLLRGRRQFLATQWQNRIEGDAWFIKPRLQWHAAQYEHDTGIATLSTGQRSLPTLSLDGGVFLERPTEWGKLGLTHTLEPRFFYTYTPYREQAHLPNYDSAPPDMNMGTLYTERAFLGNDRISDTHGLTLGATSRWIDTETGQEYIRLGLARRFLFQDQQVVLPGGSAVTKGFGDVMFQLGLQSRQAWSMNLLAQYNPQTGLYPRVVASGHYQPGPYRVLNFAVRHQRSTALLEPNRQFEGSWQWPILPWNQTALGKGQWYSVGRLSYSHTENRLIDAIGGFEYDAGCWLMRVVFERVQNAQLTYSNRLLFQIEFSGFSRLGNDPLAVLRNQIPRYQTLNATRVPSNRFSDD